MQPLKKLDEFFLGTTQAASPFGAVWSGEQLCVDVDRVHVVLAQIWPSLCPDLAQRNHRLRSGIVDVRGTTGVLRGLRRLAGGCLAGVWLVGGIGVLVTLTAKGCVRSKKSLPGTLADEPRRGESFSLITCHLCLRMCIMFGCPADSPPLMSRRNGCRLQSPCRNAWPGSPLICRASGRRDCKGLCVCAAGVKAAPWISTAARFSILVPTTTSATPATCGFQRLPRAARALRGLGPGRVL